MAALSSHTQPPTLPLGCFLLDASSPPSLSKPSGRYGVQATSESLLRSWSEPSGLPTDLPLHPHCVLGPSCLLREAVKVLDLRPGNRFLPDSSWACSVRRQGAPGHAAPSEEQQVCVWGAGYRGWRRVDGGDALWGEATHLTHLASAQLCSFSSSDVWM